MNGMLAVVVMTFMFISCLIVCYYLSKAEERHRLERTEEGTIENVTKRKAYIEEVLEVMEWANDSSHPSRIDNGSADKTEEVETEPEVVPSRHGSIASSQRPCCAICLGNFEKSELLSRSKKGSCEHVFHTECVTKWLMKHNDCPICRTRYLVETV